MMEMEMVIGENGAVKNRR